VSGDAVGLLDVWRSELWRLAGEREREALRLADQLRRQGMGQLAVGLETQVAARVGVSTAPRQLGATLGVGAPRAWWARIVEVLMPPWSRDGDAREVRIY
jgi:hypothetical protein